ncbi:MAG: hypothetical protein Kow0059_10500 [Candidatus Sumerlaeia bacterium]
MRQALPARAQKPAAQAKRVQMGGGAIKPDPKPPVGARYWSGGAWVPPLDDARKPSAHEAAE